MTFSRVGLTTTLALGIGVAAPAALAEQLTVASFVPPQHHTNAVMFAWLATELETRSGGDLALQVIPAGQLGAGPVQQYRSVVEDVADIAFGVSAYTPTVFPRTMLAILLGAAETSAEATQRILSVYDAYLAEEYENVVMLGLVTAPGDGIASTRDLSTLAAFEGAKIVPSAALTTPLIEAMGAVAVKMPVTEAMTVCKSETFGPVTSIYAIDSYEEGLDRANDTEYGLSSAIFTKDIDKAFHFARHVGAGMCHINGPTIHDEAHVPFGGNGESGVGREGTDADMEAMTELKWVTVQL